MGRLCYLVASGLGVAAILAAYAFGSLVGFVVVCATPTVAGLVAVLPGGWLELFPRTAGWVCAGSLLAVLFGTSAVDPNELGLLGSFITAPAALVVGVVWAKRQA